MSASLIPAVTDALVAMFTATLPTLAVSDGAVLQNEERAGLFVGSDADNSEFPWQQRWAGLGHVSRDETFEVPCLLYAKSGDNILKPVRDEVFGYFAALESVLRATPSLGIGTNSIRAQVIPIRYDQPQTPDGVVCRIRFNVNLEGRT